MRIGCVILAAGIARRFGQQKLHAELDGRSLILRALDAVPEDCPACVVTGDPAIRAMAIERGMKFVTNSRPEDGISRSVRLGTQALADCGAICFIPADQPLLSRRSVEKLLTVSQDNPDRIVRAVHGTVPGNPYIFPRTYFPALMELRGDRGGSAVMQENPEAILPVELPERELLDCDTPEALQKLAEKEATR